MISIIKLVQKWIEDRLVIKVTDKNEEDIEFEESTLEDQIFSDCIVGKNNDQLQFFIIIKIKVQIGKLITRYKDILVEERLRLEIKYTKYEYTKKIGIIIGPNL